MKNNLLFITTSFWAYGEVTIACEFATRAAEAGFVPNFLIPPSHEKILQSYNFPYTTMVPKNGKVNRLLMSDIEHRLKPRAVILADFLNYEFCEEHYGLSYEDLAIFSGKLATFDDFDWAVTGKMMDTYGFKAERFGEIDVRKYGYSLCPVPLVNPEGGEREMTYHYRLDTKPLPYDPDKTAMYKRHVGLPTDKKLIVFTQAQWQDTYKQYPDVIDFVNAANETFYYMLKELARDYLVLCIGPEGYFSSKVGENFLHRSSMPPHVFDQYLCAADVILSRNITSTTLGRIVLAGIPAVAFKSSLYFTEEAPFNPEMLPFKLHDVVARELTKLKRCYPYRMYPVGWFKFLGPVVKDNPYLKALKVVEQFDIEKALTTIRQILEDRHVRDQMHHHLENYLQILDKLPSVEWILTDLLSK